jgi:hypothetical protein
MVAVPVTSSVFAAADSPAKAWPGRAANKAKTKTINKGFASVFIFISSLKLNLVIGRFEAQSPDVTDKKYHYDNYSLP